MENQGKSAYNGEEEVEFTFRGALLKRKQDLVYLSKFKGIILISCLLGALLGGLLAWKWPVTYTARLTFVVEESKNSGSGLMSSLAGQFGLDLGAIPGGNGGVLAGDNVLQLLISRKMLKETLLTPVTSGSDKTLADKYAEVYKYQKKWAPLNNDKPVVFPANTDSYSRLQDSLLQVMLIRISEREVNVSKPDKKLTFFALNVTMKNEALSEMFSQRLINKASEFYISTKTKKLRNNVSSLKKQTDSVGYLLNRKSYSAAAASSVLVDVNPAYVTAGVALEGQERDKRSLQTIYTELVKNLSVSKSMLMQETPTFQIVDEPDLPLKKNKLKYFTAVAGGIFLSLGGISLLLLMFRKRD